MLFNVISAPAITLVKLHSVWVGMCHTTPTHWQGKSKEVCASTTFKPRQKNMVDFDNAKVLFQESNYKEGYF